MKRIVVGRPTSTGGDNAKGPPDLTGSLRPVGPSWFHALPLLSLLALLLLACGAASWKQDPEVRAAKEACQGLDGLDFACVERHAVEAVNPDVCRLLGIAVDDMCLQGVYEAAADPAICDQLYLEGVRPACRAYYAALVTPMAVPHTFRSNRYHLEASLPPGWAAAEGPEPLARPFSGLAAFDSWGDPGFWAPEVWTEDSATYSPRSTLGQLPSGGAYVVLVHFSGGPPAPVEDYGLEYGQDDLAGLWQPKDCREAGGATWIDFFKWGRRLRLEVYCQSNASDATASQVNDLIASWRFDRVPAGDVGWATVLARSSLPPAAHPAKFPLLSAWGADEGPLQSSSGEADATRMTQAEVRGQVVVVTFTLRWGDPAAGWSGDDCPAERCHWWRFEVWADGQLVVAGEGGAPLLNHSLEGPWRQYSNPALGFAVQVPADWEVLAVPYHDVLGGRSWKAVEFVSPDYALDYPPLDQYHFAVAVAPSPGGTLTETVELSLSPLAPGFRDQIRVQCCLAVGGERAMELLDYPLTRWGNRQLVVLHEGWEYRLTFYPAQGIWANNEAGLAAQRAVDAFLRTFAFLPITSMPPPPTPTLTPAPTPEPHAAAPPVLPAGAS